MSTSAIFPTSRLWVDVDRDLIIGMIGDDVAEMQRLLGINDTGIFGLLTGKTLRNFQYDNGLEVDGICGKRTWAKLRELNQK